jgi:hypothetical protein
MLGAMTLVPAVISLTTMAKNPRLAAPMAFVAFAMLVWIAAIAAFRRRGAARSVRNLFRNMTGRALVGSRTFTIRPDAIEVISDVFTVTYKWIGIERIDADRQHAFFYQGSASAIIVPKRAFNSETHFRVFVETARQFQREAAAAEAMASEPARTTI